MQFGFVPRRLMGNSGDLDPSRPFDEWINDLEILIGTAEKAGFQFMAMSGMQSLAHFARYAAIPTSLRFVNETLTLPMMDPVQIAPLAAHVDQMLAGRLDFGVGIGYFLQDLDAAGITRRDRVAKFVESLEIIKAMWTQDEVSYSGRYFNFAGLRPTVKPYQKPYPPIIISSQAHRSAERAGRIADGLCIAPAVGHAEVASLAKTFRDAYLAANGEQPAYVNARRDFIVGPGPREASVQAGRNEPYFQFGPGHRYIIGGLQESATVDLHLAKVEDDATSFAFCGTYQDMVEQFARVRDAAGLTHVTCSFYNLPGSFSARLEFLQGFGEEVIQKFRRS
jgi:alkanesulfonate monooxygenase SsuD/methylene tetrahydromethanopterin reductase-like flavin-dependent oxidoreductase (luciferase family)